MINVKNGMVWKQQVTVEPRSVTLTFPLQKSSSESKDNGSYGSMICKQTSVTGRDASRCRSVMGNTSMGGFH